MINNFNNLNTIVRIAELHFTKNGSIYYKRNVSLNLNFILILILSFASEIIFLSIFFKFYFRDRGLLFYNITTIHQTQGTSEL